MTSIGMFLYLLGRAFCFLVPHFETTDVALDLWENQTYTKEQLNNLDSYEIVCDIRDVEPEERFDAICTIRDLTWLGFGMFTKQLSDIRPFVNPNKGDV